MGTDEISHDDWRAACWDRPDLDRPLTSVALVDDVVVAFSFALTHNRDRYQSGMTGPRRACRGMGLARPVKLAAVRRARHAGYRHAVTSNDADNEAMLAINRRLGYRVVGGEWQYRRELRR